MKNKYLIIGLIFAALVIVLVSTSRMVDAAPLAQEPTAPRPTRDLTVKPRKTKVVEATVRPTRDRTTNPRRTKTPVPAQATETPQPAANSSGNAAGASGPITSQLLIFNADRAGTAHVTVNLFDMNGAVAFTHEYNIKQNSAKLVNIPKNMGKEFLANARIIADRRVQALVVDQSKTGGTSDMYEVLGTAATTLTLPYLRHGATGTGASENNIIAIQNTSGITTDATLTAYDLNGNVVLTHVVTIPPQTSAYVDTEDLFGETSFLGSARITAEQRLAATTLAYNGEDTASFRALATRDQDNRLVVPNIERKRRTDGILKSWHELYIRNNAAVATDILVSYYAQTGKLKGQVKRSNVPAGGLVVLDTSTDEFSFLGKKFGGWAAVASAAQAPLAVEAIAVQERGRQIVGISAAPRARINARSVCSDVRTTAKQSSILTLLNTRPKEKAGVQVRFYNRANGALVTEFTRELEPGVQLRIGPQNGLPPNFQGSALITPLDGTAPDILAAVMTISGKGKAARSTGGYVCR